MVWCGVFKRKRNSFVGDDDGWADICLVDGWHSINVNDEDLPTYRVRIHAPELMWALGHSTPVNNTSEVWICEIGMGGVYHDGWMMVFPVNWEILSGCSA